MHKYACISLFFLVLFSPFFLRAEEGYIGENPGLDFYSRIDTGSFTIKQKSISRRLSETPTLDTFGRECMRGNIALIEGIAIKPEDLDKIENLDYSWLSKKIGEKLQSNPGLGAGYSKDIFAELTRCLTKKYQDLKARTIRETNARETISYLGLYMDGDKSNSEYDIVTDIEKINGLIFSEDLKYDGTANLSKKSLSDFLSNKSLTPLLPPDILGTFASGSPLVSFSGNTSGSGAIPSYSSGTSASPPDLSTLLGTTCSLSGSTGPIDTVFDEAFLAELASVLGNGGNTASIGGGYTPPVGGGAPVGSGGSLGGGSPSPTSGSDFFHSMPCTSILCIKVKMIPGGGFSLGGGKNVSIEGMLDKHSKILYPISESALGCELMTNNAGSSPKKGLNLVKTLAGLRVYLAEKPQVTRRDKREATPDREKEELAEIIRCGYAAGGLSVDEARSRTIGGAGFNGTMGSTTDNITNRQIPTGPQETAEAKKFLGCIESSMASGRKTYYDSFSTDLAEVQTYTNAMLKEVNNIMVILTEMNYKKTQCTNS